MTAVQDPFTAPPEEAEPPRGPERGPSGRGRWLRSLVGVDEKVLGRAPLDRGRYTAMAFIVLNAGLLAAASMFVMVQKFADVPLPVALLFALFWGWIIFSVDRWLIASSHGTQGGRGVFLARIVLAVVLGFVVAEPLLIKIFEPAIHRQVAEDRRVERAARLSALTACNPVPYRRLPAKDADSCRDRRLLITVSANPVAAADTVASLDAQAAALSKAIDKDTQALRRLERLGHAECGGERVGDETTGRRGEGPNCRQIRREREAFLGTSKLPERRAQLADLQGKAKAAVEDQGRVNAAYASEVMREIDKQLPRPEGRIGILEEDDALFTLQRRSPMVFLFAVLVRLALIILDCMPVLTKRLAGLSTYDRQVADHVVADMEKHEIFLKYEKTLSVQSRLDALRVMEEQERDRRLHRERTEAEARDSEGEQVKQQIRDMAARLKGSPGPASE
ncbi:DUF4407 domain-containing protein [Actinomadura chibensis]|uniref:DUF4407 domain-containing protein n=1 Tax=Actinomadura chibensis TaxID=392828 RepID=A0A5D0NHY3_9ACTN|nr:DUF4407 domain-containing protein [Actinomadura chibensis]TYB44046.1 DUF4407 domain-containing protein [Actinomadura chibensis]